MLRKFRLFLKHKQKVLLKFRLDFDLVKKKWRFNPNK
jgi:hypothetical protein